VRLRTVPDGEASGANRPLGTTRFELEGRVAEPMPADIVEALLGTEPGGSPLGERASISGELGLAIEDGEFNGTARVRVEQVDLAALSRHLPHRLVGEATVSHAELTCARGRITACNARIDVSRGRVAQPLLDAAVSMLGCRPGPAFRSLTGEEARSFDDLAILLTFSGAGVEVCADPTRAGGLARVQGLAIVEEPRVPVPLDRLAWFLAPPGARALPAARATAWLLERLSWDTAAAPEAARIPANQAVRPTGRSEF
jgi:hypothetical protein